METAAEFLDEREDFLHVFTTPSPSGERDLSTARREGKQAQGNLATDLTQASGLNVHPRELEQRLGAERGAVGAPIQPILRRVVGVTQSHVDNC